MPATYTAVGEHDSLHLDLSPDQGRVAILVEIFERRSERR
jgi:hypothetical protein